VWNLRYADQAENVKAGWKRRDPLKERMREAIERMKSREKKWELFGK